jgi:hypothetical protein
MNAKATANEMSYDLKLRLSNNEWAILCRILEAGDVERNARQLYAGGAPAVRQAVADWKDANGPLCKVA